MTIRKTLTIATAFTTMLAFPAFAETYAPKATMSQGQAAVQAQTGGQQNQAQAGQQGQQNQGQNQAQAGQQQGQGGQQNCAQGQQNCGQNQAQNAQGQNNQNANVVQVAQNNPKFSTLIQALKAADMEQVLANAQNVTVFAPTNEAFAKLPEGALATLLKPENKEKLQNVLKYHVLGQTVASANINPGLSQVQTLQGSKLQVVREQNKVTVNGAHVTGTDMNGNNGVIHTIDAVMMPKS